jgi:hypothetical protein
MRFRNRSDAARHSAHCRWRAAAGRADEEREAGISDREPMADARQPFSVDLRGAGGGLVTFEPRRGYISWRRLDESGKVTDCAALKTLLHRLADSLPPTMGARRLS